ncbi:hypothetical protein AO242_11725 [Pseudomonas sp. ICMP 561]|nr:hypothetical protein AO242_11725 [Pseudomonas sp. ICMP 561]
MVTVMWEPSLLAINDNAVHLPIALDLSRASHAPTRASRFKFTGGDNPRLFHLLFPHIGTIIAGN